MAVMARISQSSVRLKIFKACLIGIGSDFSIFGSEAGFRCDLKGKLRFGSRLSRMEIRKIESELRSSMSFISAVAWAMNDLDTRRELDWATLECEKRKREER